MFRIFLPILCFLLSTSIVFADDLILSRDGATDYLIVIPSEPSEVERTAAYELKKGLDAVTGAEFLVRREHDVAKIEKGAERPQIMVGRTQRAATLFPDLDPESLPEDAVVRRSKGRELFLIGHPRRASLYAVYTFLEDVVGVRFWSSDETFYPDLPTLTVSEQNFQYVPVFTYRDISFRDVFLNDFPSRLKLNGNRARSKPSFGGDQRFVFFAHSFYNLIPPEKYFEKHPEWFSELNGRRTFRDAQLCLTNEDMRRELIRNALEAVRKSPHCRFISISQNDWHGHCECAACKSVIEQEGALSGVLVRFVNAVAEGIEKEFPDLLVETLAYQRTEKPPRHVRPRKNVVIRLSSISCSFAQPLATGDSNRSFRENLDGWSRITENLFVWDYVVNFGDSMLPYPNLHVLGPNIRFFLENKARGVYEQGDPYCAGGDFARLKAWVLARLLWNPTLDDQLLIEEFLDGYYGSASATSLKEYWDLLADRAQKAELHLGWKMPSVRTWLDHEDLERADRFLDQAQAAAGNDVFRNRIRRERLPLDLAFLREDWHLRRQAALSGTPTVARKDVEAALDDFFVRCKEFGVESYRFDDRTDQEKFALFEREMRQRFVPESPRPGFCENVPEKSLLDVPAFELDMLQPRRKSFWVEDECASKSRAIRMNGGDSGWDVGYVFDKLIFALKPLRGSGKSEPICRIYASVRGEARTDEGIGLRTGVYDQHEKRSVLGKVFPLKEIRGREYRWIDLGTAQVRPGQRIWFAPPKRPDEVDGVYVDRILIVREE